MAFKLDEILNERKPKATILDLSQAVITSKEDLERALEKLPDYKMKAEKVHCSDVRIERQQNFRSTRQERFSGTFDYADPMPASMRSVNVEELSRVSIPWRMLTTARPENSAEEEFFNRLMILARAKRVARKTDSELPNPSVVARTKQARRSKSHVTEMHFPSCRECHVELCQGGCRQQDYNRFTRQLVETSEEEQTGNSIAAQIEGASSANKSNKKGKFKSRSTAMPRIRRKTRKRHKKKRRSNQNRESEDESDNNGDNSTVQKQKNAAMTNDVTTMYSEINNKMTENESNIHINIDRINLNKE